MKIRDEDFRKLYKNPIIIKDEEISRKMAKSLLIDSVFEDGLSGEEIKERIDAIEIDERINSLLVIPYIDHTAGMSFHVLTTSSIKNGNVEIFKRDDFTAMITSRKDNVNDCEFEYLENLKVNEDFSPDDYSQSVELINNYFVNDDVEQLRFVEILDSSRHEDFPDDVEVLFIKEGLQIEKMWVRYEKIIEVPLIEGKLLNDPFQDFGISAGDKVRFIPYVPDDSDDCVLLCNLDNDKFKP